MGAVSQVETTYHNDLNTEQIQSGHYPMITKPDEVVDALVNLT